MVIMGLKNLWEKYEDGNLERPMIALCVYYQYQYEGVTEENIREMVAESDVHISQMSINQYIDFLLEENYLQQTGEGGYRLTEYGRNEVERRLSDDARMSTEAGNLVDPEVFNKSVYTRTANNINTSYYRGIYDAAAILYRKLVEDLIYYILSEEVSDADRYMYKQNGNYVRIAGISDLIEVFEEEKDRFRPYDRDVDDWLPIIEDMKEMGNIGAHNMFYGVNEDKLKNIREDANMAMRRLAILQQRVTDNDSVTHEFDTIEFSSDIL